VSLPHVVLLQLAIADYRDAFMRLLLSSVDGLEVQVGEHYFDASTRTSAAVLAMKGVRRIDNRYWLGRFAWQSLDWRAVLRADVVIAELNPRILSNWCVLLLRRLFGKRTLLWGHAWPRAGGGSRTESLRYRMRRLASGLVLYTESQRRELAQRYGNAHPMFVAPNALYGVADMCASQGDARDFIYVGRLIRSKKVSLLVDAFAQFVKREPDARLHLVGTGEESGMLQAEVQRRAIPNVVFHGHVADPERLKDLYRGCVAAVSPGYVGLSITQSFSFGVPMIIARQEPHSPEIECAVDGVNCSFFESDSASSLGAQMDHWYARRGTRDELAMAIVADCRVRYSTERMVGGFVEAIEGVGR